MGLAYLKVDAEVAMKVIEEQIVAGYQMKDSIAEAYGVAKKAHSASAGSNGDKAVAWAEETIERLSTVFVSEKELYNFRDAEVGVIFTGPLDGEFKPIIANMQARINVLNHYFNLINKNFDVHLEVVHGDKITQIGDGTNNVRK